MPEDSSNLQELIAQFGDLIDSLIPIVAAIAVLAFFWGLAKYVLAAGNEDAKVDGRRIMVGGIIAIFIIASLGGIIDVLGDMLGINTDDGGTITPPSVQGVGGGS